MPIVQPTRRGRKPTREAKPMMKWAIQSLYPATHKEIAQALAISRGTLSNYTYDADLKVPMSIIKQLIKILRDNGITRYKNGDKLTVNLFADTMKVGDW